MDFPDVQHLIKYSYLSLSQTNWFVVVKNVICSVILLTYGSALGIHQNLKNLNITVSKIDKESV